MKRGEHIKNWRRRYFILREDGTFYGYRSYPKVVSELSSIIGNRFVRSGRYVTAAEQFHGAALSDSLSQQAKTVHVSDSRAAANDGRRAAILRRVGSGAGRVDPGDRDGGARAEARTGVGGGDPCESGGEYRFGGVEEVFLRSVSDLLSVRLSARDHEYPLQFNDSS